MLKLFIATLVSSLLLVCGVVVFYWRDTGYDPSAIDLVRHLLLLPLLISVILWLPWAIYRVWKAQQQRKEQRKQDELAQSQQIEAVEKQAKPVDIEWIQLNIYSSAAYSALGENETIIDELQKFKSPELDTQLQNNYGLPMLSYRIQALDNVITNADKEDEFEIEHPRHQRIQALIEHQLEQHAETLWQIAQHLKQSALFYDSELAYEYRMHPAWIDPNSEYASDVQDDQESIKSVTKLNRIHIHILLSESVLHFWNEAQSFEIVEHYLRSLGIITAQIQIEHHYLSQETAYKDWVLLLAQLSKQLEEISLILNVDSEIDQELLDEKTWLTDRYLPSEYASSWCLAASFLQLLETTPQKKLNIGLNVDNILDQLPTEHIVSLEQLKPVQPFVLILDDMTNIPTIKKVNHAFSQSHIEPHHFIYTKQSLGDTQHLGKVFGFMLSMHLPDELMTMIYSVDQSSTHCFIQAYEDMNEKLAQSI